MSEASTRGRLTRAVDGAPAATFNKGTITIVSTANKGNVKPSTAGAKPFFGVLTENTDRDGYAAVQIRDVAQFVCGATPITTGQTFGSDANGLASPILQSGGGTAGLQIVGVALQDAAAGATFDGLIQPQLCAI